MSLAIAAAPLASSLSSSAPHPTHPAHVGAVDVLATLESIDRPSSTATYDDAIPPLDLHREAERLPASASSAFAGISATAKGGVGVESEAVPARRVSRVPPPPTIYPGYYATTSSLGWGGASTSTSASAAGSSAGPSRQQRYFFVGVRRGHQQGVYTCWSLAERQIIRSDSSTEEEQRSSSQDHPSPVFKTFSTRLAAEAYISGWDGAGRHSLPSSSPRPLREHLAMNFPSSVSAPSSSSSTSRPSYHARLLSPSIPPTDAGTLRTDFGPRPNLTSRNSASYRHSLVKVSSPLRQEVDESTTASTSRPSIVRKSSSFMSIGGLLSPPSSPEDTPKPPPPVWGNAGIAATERGRAFRPRSMMEGKAFQNFADAARPPTPPTSPPTSPAKRPPPKRTASGLWADAIPATPSSLSTAKSNPQAASPPDVDFSANAMAPKFSRSGIKKSGVVMPVSAPRSSSSSSLSSLRGKSSRSSLNLTSPSSTSLSSITSRTPTIRRASKNSPFNSQDRLSSLAETSQKELQLNEEGLLALDSLSPPRPAFMRQRSSSSLSSLSSFTSAASSLDTCDPIAELDERATMEASGLGVVPGKMVTKMPMEVQDEDIAARAEEMDAVDELGAMVISCTKSDADADGSVESSSMKSGSGGNMDRRSKDAKKKGGLFKRLTKALKLEKKVVPGNESGRRGSM